MKVTPCKAGLVLLALIGCGIPPQPVTITADSVLNMNMVGQCWTFQNGFGDTNKICVEKPEAMTRTNPDGTVTTITWNDPSQVAGRTGNNLVLHFIKSASRTYWALDVPDAELWFVLHQDDDGSWRSTASLINFASGCPWCASNPSISTFDVEDDPPDMPLPFLIAPPTVEGNQHLVNETVVDAIAANGLTYDKLSPSLVLAIPGEYWRTDFYLGYVTTSAYTGPAIVSDQFENQCGHERWFWAPNKGIVRIESPNDGAQIKRNPGCAIWGGVDIHDPRRTINRVD